MYSVQSNTVTRYIRFNINIYYTVPVTEKGIFPYETLHTLQFYSYVDQCHNTNNRVTWFCGALVKYFTCLIITASVNAVTL